MNRFTTRSLREPELDDDQAIPDELAARLCHASTQTVPALVGGLTLAQRANLARFCYRKSHLREIGLAIAATCDEPSLVGAWGKRLGHALFCQSHDVATYQDMTGDRRRTRITLGTKVGCPGLREDEDLDDDAIAATKH